MNKKDYSVLIKEFSERLPHDLYFSHCGKVHKLKSIELDDKNILNNRYPIEICYPYLRPMSSMTNEEYNEYSLHDCSVIYDDGKVISNSGGTDWLMSHHFDYRGLIPMGLALEAPDDMYNN